MSEFSALTTVIVISLVLSSGTVVAIYRPLHQLLEAVCPLGFTAEPWPPGPARVDCAMGSKNGFSTS